MGSFCFFLTLQHVVAFEFDQKVSKSHYKIDLIVCSKCWLYYVQINVNFFSYVCRSPLENSTKITGHSFPFSFHRRIFDAPWKQGVPEGMFKVKVCHFLCYFFSLLFFRVWRIVTELASGFWGSSCVICSGWNKEIELYIRSNSASPTAGKISSLSAAAWLCLSVKDKYTISPCRAPRHCPRLSQWQLNSFLIKGELVRLNCNLMQIWSRNDSQ